MSPTAIPEELIRCYEEKYTDENGKEKTRKISLMYRRDVPQFRTVFLTRAIDLFNNWNLFNKMPPSGTWANERNVTSRILSILASEDNKFDAWEREVEEAKRKR